MITDRLSNPRGRAVAGVLASILLLAVYARAPQAWALGFVALVPWLLVLDGLGTTRGTLFNAVMMSIAFMAAVFSWFGVAIGAYTGVGAVPATLVLVVLAPLLQPQLIAFALVRHLAGQRHGPLLRALAAASAWVACESLLPKLLGDTLAHGLFPSAAMRQGADVVGAAGLTLLLLLVNEAVATAITRRRDGMRATVRPLVLAAVVVLAMGGYGMVRLASLKAPSDPDVPTLRIAMVQAGITDYERLRRELGAYAVVRKVLDTHYALSMSAIRDHGADVLLWSETVYPTTFGSPRSEDGAALDREIQGFVDTMDVPLVFGSYEVDADGEYNAAVFLEPGRGAMGTYRKTHPFPLTEYVPRWLDGTWLRRVLPWAGTWQPGDGARVMPLRSADGREVNVVPLICLDDVHPGVAIDGARLGAQAIIGMSNDSWFTAQPIGARLHLAVAAFRTIETRLPQVRVTTNGLSAIIDDTGEVVAATGMGQQAVLTAFVSAQAPSPTLMVRWGDWVGRAGAWFLLALLAWTWWRARRARATAAAVAPAVAAVAVMPPVWRAVAGTLQLCAVVGLAWLALDMALRIGWQVQSLTQLWRFALAVVAPAVAAWAVVYLHRAQAGIEDGAMVLVQRHRRIEIPLASIAALRPWRLPVPGSGVDLQLASGRRWPDGLRVSRPDALRQRLEAAGASLLPAGGVDQLLASHADARAAATRPRLDRALVKFLLFPLLPALVAFRLHQVIAFGGTFGEYYTYGAVAWLSGLLIWWGSWALGLMLLASALRIAIETVSVFAHLAQPGRATAVRDALESLGRLAYYVGVPTWLVLRVVAGN